MPCDYIMMKVSAFILNRKSGKFHSIRDERTFITCCVIYSLKYIAVGVGCCLFDARYSRTSG